MEAVLQAMGYDKNIFKILLIQFVSLLRGGKKSIYVDRVWRI
ncbi:MAG: hypothetical protein CM1200mP16_13440 [Nitrospina sp.]|nr:MAG: hypothetical protein CM1200mP16_13440 [Nitrospina sp.]